MPISQNNCWDPHWFKTFKKGKYTVWDSFSSLTSFKPAPGQTLKGGTFCDLLGKDQLFTGEIEISYLEILETIR